MGPGGPKSDSSESHRRATVSRREIQGPAILRLDLLDLHSRDGARDDQALNFTGPFEDRVGPIGATISTGHGTFRSEIDPQMSGNDPVSTRLGPIPDPVDGSPTTPLQPSLPSSRG
jgi:hypothetical protein